MCSRLCCCIIFTLRPNLRGKVEPTDVEMVETTTEPKGCDFQQDVDYTFVGGAWYYVGVNEDLLMFSLQHICGLVAFR